MLRVTASSSGVRLSVAVVVCAYTMDRWDELCAAYRSLANQEEAAAEVLVVIDHNDQLLQRFRAEYPGADIVPNTGPKGLSGARNTGVEVTSADVVLFLDDDAWAEPDWTRLMTDVFQDTRVIGVAGHAEPLWDPPGKPGWFPDEFLWVVGCSYRGLPVSRSPIRNPIGSTMGFRRSALASTTGFSTDVGRVGTHPIGGEETELSIRLHQALPGSTIVLEPKAVVHHKVSAPRLKFRYFVSRCYWEGVSKAVVAEGVGTGDALESERAYTVKVLPLAVLRGFAEAIRGDLDGARRAGSVLVGLGMTALGFARGLVNRKFRSVGR